MLADKRLPANNAWSLRIGGFHEFLQDLPLILAKRR
jgi:hypothetical protein